MTTAPFHQAISTDDDPGAAPARPVSGPRLVISSALAGLAVIAAIATKFLDEYSVKRGGEDVGDIGRGMSFFGETSLTSGYGYLTSLFALAALLITALVSTGRLNIAARLAAAGTGLYAIATLFAMKMMIADQLNLDSGPSPDGLNRVPVEKVEVTLTTGGYTALAAIVLLTAAVVIAGPALSSLPAMAKVRAKTAGAGEDPEDGREIQVTAG